MKHESQGLVVWKTLSTHPDYWLLTGNGLTKVPKEKLGEEREVGDWVGGQESKKDVEAFLGKRCAPRDFKPLVDYDVARQLKPLILATAGKLQRRLFELTPVIAWFHDDSDGICSALLLKKALQDFLEQNQIEPPTKKFLVFKQAWSAVYSEKNLLEDGEDALDYPKKPLLLLLDHAANPESLDAVSQARESGFEVFIVDHHPPAKQVAADHFLSPFAVKEGSSDYCTGLLAFELARAIAGKADEELAWQALWADHSSFRREQDSNEAIALDYLSIAKRYPVLEDYEELLAKPFAIKLAVRKANAAVEAALKKAEATAKRTTAGEHEIVALKLGFLRKGAYPSKGKVVNAFQKKHSPAVSIAAGGSSLLFRVSKEGHAAGFKANEVIAALKEAMPHAIESGGGHERAASLRVTSEEFAGKALEKAVELAKAIFCGERT